MQAKKLTSLHFFFKWLLLSPKETRKNQTSFFLFFIIIEFEKALHHNQNDGPDVAIGQQKAGAIEIDRF
jgi:hypothetical protein